MKNVLTPKKAIECFTLKGTVQVGTVVTVLLFCDIVGKN